MSAQHKHHGKNGQSHGVRVGKKNKNKNKSRPPMITHDDLPLYIGAMKMIIDKVRETVGGNYSPMQAFDQNYKTQMEAIDNSTTPDREKLGKYSALFSRALAALDLVLHRHDGQNDISHALQMAKLTFFTEQEVKKTIPSKTPASEIADPHNKVVENQAIARVTYALLKRARKAAGANKRLDLIFEKNGEPEKGLYTKYKTEIDAKTKAATERYNRFAEETRKAVTGKEGDSETKGNGDGKTPSSG